MKLARLLLALCAATASAQIFDYDKSAPLNLTLQQKDDRDGVRLFSCTFDTIGGKATGYLVEPDTPGPHPAIVWKHSNGALGWVADATLLAHAGAVSLIVDEPAGGPDTAEGFRDSMIHAVIAIRRAVDVLESRPNVDARRIAYVGHSFGAMMGADAVSVDSRFRAAVFEVGLLGMDVHIGTSPHPWAAGIRKSLGDKLPEFLKTIEPLNTSHFLPHAAHIPLLFQSARYDPGVPEKDSLDFYNIANQPKELRWYPTGHDVSDMHAIADRAEFLKRNLAIDSGKPVVVVISIDGFPAYALDNDKLPAPTLRRLIAEGAWAKRMTPINPTVTWPNHTTLVTGVDARKHGVLFNGLLNKDTFKIEPWVDKEKWVRARTIYDAAFEAGLTTAQVDWVAIYHAKTITWQFPEEPNPEGEIERAVLTHQEALDFIKKSNPAWRDEKWTAAAVAILKEHKPNLLLFHLLDLDSVHHQYGPGSTASFAAIAYADRCVQRILDAIDEAGLKDRATVIVVSDHGFKKVEHVIQLPHFDGTIIPEGGTAMVYSRGNRSITVAAFKRVEGIDRIIEPSGYAALELPTPAENQQAPDLLLVAKDGYAFSKSPTSGQHGYLASDPDMDSIFIAWGRGIRSGARAERIRNVDVAPTIAELLGVPFNGTDGRALTEFLAPK